jgi:hypothetical protein
MPTDLKKGRSKKKGHEPHSFTRVNILIVFESMSNKYH